MTTRKATVPIMRVIWALMRNQPIRYPISLCAWTVIWTMPVLIGFISAAFFDSLTGQAAGWNVATVIAAVWAWSVARMVSVFLAMRLHSSVLFRANAGMKRNMLSWIYSLPGAHPLAETPGEVVSRFRDDVEHTTEAFDFTVDLVGSGVSAIVSFVILMLIDPFITLTVFSPVALIILVTSRLGTRIRRYRSAARDATEGITGFLGETLGSVQSVKVAGAEQTMLARFEQLNDTRRKMMVRDRTFTAGLEAVFFNTVSIGTGLILILAVGSLSDSGSAGLTIGQFALFVYLLQMVTDSAWFIGIFLARVKQAGVSVERIVALMEGSTWRDVVRKLDIDDPAPSFPAVVTREVAGAPLLAVRALTYHYPASGQGIEDIDLDVASGAFVVVTGRIGAGKTTLLRTILGLVPAESGEIRWRGAVVDDPATAMVPPRAAYTPQVPRLFSMTLRDNLLLGHAASDEQLQAAVATATLEHDLELMGEGFDTLIGPRGVRLSGGQIQRSAAARMLVRAPDLLVFDDLSSALDVETEATLWERLFADYRGSTALVVSHRRPALMRADQVIVLEQGRVVDRGTAEELLQRSEAFRELWG
jgi:ATP-binding cassette subfamily B protein